MAEVGKTKLELNQRIQRLESERQSQSELYDKVARLEKELEGIANIYVAYVRGTPLYGVPILRDLRPLYTILHFASSFTQRRTTTTRQQLLLLSRRSAV